MSEDQPKQTKLEKKRKKALTNLFDTISDEINIFNPTQEGEQLLGKIVEYGISKEYETPFLILTDKDDVEITVFIKMGIIPKFMRKKWIDKNDQWVTETIDRQIGELIGFLYCGTEISERTKREFQKYKIAFPKDLKEAGITLK